MRAIIIGAAIAAATVAGCTFKSTTVRREAPPPATVVYAQPAPTVVYQSPPTVVYQQPPAVYSAPSQTVAVNYRGTNGFEVAAQKADAYCEERYGSAGVRLLTDNRSAGRATFACVN